MPEQVQSWWRRRQWSKGVSVPYEIGCFRSEWRTYPVLVRQYHPDLNDGITLSQIPPAADVYVQWQCDSGHRFVATPGEQRARPGRSRRKSSWCPECASLATRKTAPKAPKAPKAPQTPTESTAPRAAHNRPAASLCTHSRALDHAVGEAFASSCAPKPASAIEDDLRSRLFARLDLQPGLTAMRVAKPFFSHVEVWPDLVLDELKVAIELDTVGRDGLEHVGEREVVDRRKDRLLRAAGWEVIRVRVSPLLTIGPHDVLASGVSAKLLDRLVDELCDIRGDLFVRAYLRA